MVEEIASDIGIRKDNRAKMIEKLKIQGIKTNQIELTGELDLQDEKERREALNSKKILTVKNNQSKNTRSVPKILTLKEREQEQKKIVAIREKAALALQANFRGHRIRNFVECVKRTQEAETRRQQELQNEAVKSKKKFIRPALKTYHGF